MEELKTTEVQCSAIMSDLSTLKETIKSLHDIINGLDIVTKSYRYIKEQKGEDKGILKEAAPVREEIMICEAMVTDAIERIKKIVNEIE